MIIIFISFLHSKSQNFKNSNLPIIIITTDIDKKTGKPAEIPDEPKVLGNMKIIYHPDGSRNYLTDSNKIEFINYKGRIAIELRGSTSQNLPKKPYGFETRKEDNITNNNVSLLGMPEENDWVLNNLPFEPGLIRDFLSYNLYADMGYYSPRTVYVEVVVNGDYKGIYLLTEKIKVDKNRVNIIETDKNDNTYPDVTGGYITKADKTTGGDPVAWTMESYFMNVSYIHDTPEPDSITSAQHDYIKKVFFDLQSAITSKNASIVDGYPSMIDVLSFIDYMIISELSSNADAYQLSTYFHKDRLGKLKAGPVWDFNLTYGNDLFIYGLNRSFTYVWQFDNNSNNGSKFWKDLFDDPLFNCYLSKRWKELTAPGKCLNKNIIYNKIDSVHAIIAEAADREQQRWGTVGNLDNNISSMKNWILTRMTWLNSKLCNFEACTNVETPKLVISKINYHPLKDGDFSSSDLEFIEIVNNSAKNTDLTGIFFSGLGITYSFPANTTLESGKKLYLANNDSVFKVYYGFVPFGKYKKDLSNKSEKLILSDAFGNIIDYVNYFDSIPWPEEADGNGYYLMLKDLNLDNSLASSWIASNKKLTSIGTFEPERVTMYPNPAKSYVKLQFTHAIPDNYTIIDMFGNIVGTGVLKSSSEFIDIQTLNKGIYILKLNFDNSDNTYFKLIKE